MNLNKHVCNPNVSVAAGLESRPYVRESLELTKAPSLNYWQVFK